VNGCIELNHTKITIDISQYTTAGNILLMNSTIGCLNIENITISFTHEPSCIIPKYENDSSSIYVIIDINEDKECKPNYSTAAVVIVIVFIGLAIGAILTVYFVPSLRAKVFKNFSVRLGIKKKIALDEEKDSQSIKHKQVEIKMGELRESIRDVSQSYINVEKKLKESKDE